MRSLYISLNEGTSMFVCKESAWFLKSCPWKVSQDSVAIRLPLPYHCAQHIWHEALSVSGLIWSLCCKCQVITVGRCGGTEQLKLWWVREWRKGMPASQPKDCFILPCFYLVQFPAYGMDLTTLRVAFSLNPLLKCPHSTLMGTSSISGWLF